MTYSTGELAARLRVSGTTIRNWADRFSDFMEPGATPPPGQIRAYSEQDALVLATIAREADRRAPTDEIRRLLKDESNLVTELPTLLPTASPAPKGGEGRALVQVQKLTWELAQSQHEIIRLEAELERTREERDSEREKGQARVEELLRKIGALERELELYEAGKL
jgi:DNA-binding transcriptional MerR regulator